MIKLLSIYNQRRIQGSLYDLALESFIRVIVHREDKLLVVEV
ncbi:hypothetical protein [Sulfoacidibacillus thermotolerans]|nr:hypothetical protein [Sulfoacidibacillus thermotolerans]